MMAMLRRDIGTGFQRREMGREGAGLVREGPLQSQCAAMSRGLAEFMLRRSKKYLSTAQTKSRYKTTILTVMRAVKAIFLAKRPLSCCTVVRCNLYRRGEAALPLLPFLGVSSLMNCGASGRRFFLAWSPD
jgi:hypothetical protein